MIVVSDTSCVSNLLTIGKPDLLANLFGEVIIPPAVERELRRFHSAIPAFLKVVVPTREELLARLSRELHAGEAEAICVACELKADRLLIDEKAGRSVALREGLAIIGVVGVLLAAKQKGLLPSLTELLNRLETDAGFRLNQSVKAAALKAAGEATDA
jgi:predicted nucleic acid-binding protein